MFTLRLTSQSLWNRRLTSVLTVFSIGISVAVLLTIDRLREGAREGFTHTISQTDLIVGAKGGSVQLLLYAVFRLGSATDNITYETYEDIRNLPEVAWTIPYSLGDSYRGFRVVGTDGQFYERYRYHSNESIKFISGHPPYDLFDVVLGSEVAERLQHKLNDKISLSHGVGDVLLQDHADKPFRVVGILAPTMTPIDRSVYVSLEAIEAIHVDWSDGAPPIAGHEISADVLRANPPEIRQITAFLLGAKSRLSTLQLQREINDYKEEALTAIIPGVALSELWDGLSYAENALQAVSILVIVTGLLGMTITIYNSLHERRREMSILRSLGASPSSVFIMLMTESFLLTIAGIITGFITSYAFIFAGRFWLERNFGLTIPLTVMSVNEFYFALGACIFGLLLGIIPAWRAYRNTLQDGLVIRV